MAYSAFEFQTIKLAGEHDANLDIHIVNRFERELDAYLEIMNNRNDYSNKLTNFTPIWHKMLMERIGICDTVECVIECVLRDLSYTTCVTDSYSTDNAIFINDIDLNEHQLSILTDRYQNAGWTYFKKYTYIKTNEHNISLFLSIDEYNPEYSFYIMCICETPPKFFYQLIK